MLHRGGLKEFREKLLSRRSENSTCGLESLLGTIYLLFIFPPYSALSDSARAFRAWGRVGGEGAGEQLP